MSLISRSPAYEQKFNDLNEHLDIEFGYEYGDDYELRILEEHYISNPNPNQDEDK